MPEIVLQATGLAKAFAAPAGPLPVLTAVSLEVRAGESVSIRGSSGSGKTTLLQLLGGLDVPDAGEVRVACEGALVAPRRRLGRGVGFVFQNYQLMPELTALEPYRQMMIGGVVKGKDPAAQKEWAARQLYIALGQLMGAAAALAVDTCALEGIDPAAYTEILGLQGTGYEVVVACAVGYRSGADKYAQLKKIRYPKARVIAQV